MKKIILCLALTAFTLGAALPSVEAASAAKKPADAAKAKSETDSKKAKAKKKHHSKTKKPGKVYK